MQFNQNQFNQNQFGQDDFVAGFATVGTGAGTGFATGTVGTNPGQVNNFVNHTAAIGTTQAVENTNYYDTYHHRINNYHTINTNRYKDHYVDHNVYYNNTRNVYDGADYHRAQDSYITDPVATTTNGCTGTVAAATTTTNGCTGAGATTNGSYIRRSGCGCRFR